MDDTRTFEKRGSKVCGHRRDVSAVFYPASGHRLADEQGGSHDDFLPGAGALNRCHDGGTSGRRISGCFTPGGIPHPLDFHTAAERSFIEDFQSTILRPRGLAYVLQFTGPTGTSAVEAALKPARLETGRHGVIAFTDMSHGPTLGAPCASSAPRNRAGSGLPFPAADRLPFDGHLGVSVDRLDDLESALDDLGGGIDLPAALVPEADLVA